ncbi:MAG: tetratricopeptide repeat protein [Xanthobacteraceae bacterium]|nr:tetratricopeptide repeat protein [Xanthobacteraceae bacterium]
MTAASVQTILRDAVGLHQMGRLGEAETLYRAALDKDPKNFDALHLLGRIRVQQGRQHDAVPLLSAAVKRNPRSVDALMLLGSTQIALGRLDEALSCFDQAARAEPNNHQVQFNRAVALELAGRLSQALPIYDRLVRENPRDVQTWLNRGTVLGRLGKFEQAVESLDAALALQPNNGNALNNRGNALNALGRHEEAIEDFNRVLSVEPNRVDTLSNRATVLNALGRRDEALSDCDRAISIRPDYATAFVTRGNVLHGQERYEESLANYDRALALRPQDVGALTNRGISLLELGRFEESLTDAERAIAIDPKHPGGYLARGKALQALARYEDAIENYKRAIALGETDAAATFNLAICRLWLGKFAEGWSTYVWDLSRYQQAPVWNGGYVSGTLLIWANEGIGDQILYSSAIPEVSRHADRVVVEVDPRLRDLFARSFPMVEVIPAQARGFSEKIDAHHASSSLARYLRPDWQSSPSLREGFLKPSPDLVSRLRNRFSNDRRPTIGLSWVSKNQTIGRFKSARLTDFDALLRLPGYRFVDLQYGDTLSEREEVERAFGVRVERLDDIDNTNDLDGLAALMAACDAVLTVSSSTAHLAGAVGVRTFVMVPFGRGHLWYWFADRAASPWYPNVQVRRRGKDQSWSEMIAELVPDVVAAAALPRVD